MVHLFICAWIACAGLGQTKEQIDVFKKEAALLRAAADEAVNSSVPGMALLQVSKATYLEGYGVVVTLEAQLEATRNPFSSPKSPAEIRTIVAQRRKDVQQKLEKLVKDRTGTLKSIGDTESLTVVLYLFNSNPADLTDLPSQIVFSARKQDPADIKIRVF